MRQVCPAIVIRHRRDDPRSIMNSARAPNLSITQHMRTTVAAVARWRTVLSVSFGVHLQTWHGSAKASFATSATSLSRDGITTTSTPAHTAKATTVKYCTHCGRLISSNHAHFAERKTCSKLCARTRLTSIDRQLEDLFIELASAGKPILCTEVERTWVQRHGADRAEGGDREKWRQRVRQAGRRVVAFKGDNGNTFVGVQGSRPVELSFAKGDWAVKMVAPMVT